MGIVPSKEKEVVIPKRKPLFDGYPSPEESESYYDEETPTPTKSKTKSPTP